MVIEKATLADIDAITEIYNQAISARHQTAHLDLISREERMDWMQNRDHNRHPIFTCKIENNSIAYGYLSPYRLGRRAFDGAAEVSYYVHKNHQGKGIGKHLLTHLIAHAKKLDYHTLVAILLGTNAPSIGLLKKFGFEEWGLIHGAAEIDGDWFDHLYYGLKIQT